jgi:hypothetical protein
MKFESNQPQALEQQAPAAIDFAVIQRTLHQSSAVLS